MSGTGRRRKPPVGEEGEPQGGQPAAYEPYAQQQPQSQWQTYSPAPEPQYDYDWRDPQTAAQPPAAPAQPAGPQQAAPQAPPAAEPWPPQYQQPYQEYQIPQPRWEQPAPAAYADPEIPAAPPAPAPAQPAASAPTDVFSTRPKPRPEPTADPFTFEFDPDADDAPAASSATATRPAAGRPADKDGYRPNDFSFVDEADEPDVKGWLEFSESRADARAERLRRLRTKLVAVVIVLALAGAGYGVYSLFGGSTPTVAAAATKSMLLFQLDDASGDSVGDALLVTNRGGAQDGSDVTGTGDVVVIPATMQIQSDFGTQPFGGDMTGTPIEPPADDSEVAATLGVTPDGDLTMDETTFGIFVDELGGLTVTTNTAVPASSADPSGVKQGTGLTLTGAQTVAYATYQASGESDSAQAVRFSQVVTALLNKLPTFGNAVTAQLNQLGLITKPSMPLSKLSPILAALAAQQEAGKVTEAMLPLSQDGTDTLNYAAAAPLVSKLLGGTMKAGASAGQAARVLVEDGTGLSSSKSQTLIADAEADLQNAGYTFNGGESVSEQAKTVVEVANASQQGLAQQVATALGLSGSTVKVVSDLAQVDDVTVVLGADWSQLAGTQ